MLFSLFNILSLSSSENLPEYQENSQYNIAMQTKGCIQHCYSDQLKNKGEAALSFICHWTKPYTCSFLGNGEVPLPSWCNLTQSICVEEKKESSCLESQSPPNLHCYIPNKGSFCPSIPPVSSETNSVFSCNIEISLALPAIELPSSPSAKWCSLGKHVHSTSEWAQQKADLCKNAQNQKKISLWFIKG